MLKSTLARLREDRSREFEGEEVAEAGFTLIELMVVLLIIAILLAIAIPTFLGVTGSANDRAAQSNLTNALTEVKAIYQNNQSYNTASMPTATLTASAPEFTWSQNAGIAGTQKGSNVISEYPVDVVNADDGLGVVLASWAKGTSTCWYAVDLESAPGTASFTDTTGTAVFFGSTSVADGQELSGTPVAALTTAGVYYAKVVNATTCNASTPTGTNQWVWGTSYSNAPIS